MDKISNSESEGTPDEATSEEKSVRKNATKNTSLPPITILYRRIWVFCQYWSWLCINTQILAMHASHWCCREFIAKQNEMVGWHWFDQNSKFSYSHWSDQFIRNYFVFGFFFFLRRKILFQELVFFRIHIFRTYSAINIYLFGVIRYIDVCRFVQHCEMFILPRLLLFFMYRYTTKRRLGNFLSLRRTRTLLVSMFVSISLCNVKTITHTYC